MSVDHARFLFDSCASLVETIAAISLLEWFVMEQGIEPRACATRFHNYREPNPCFDRVIVNKFRRQDGMGEGSHRPAAIRMAKRCYVCN